jgi:zinc D-Ala-D-Ala carboxypeptidase
MDWSKYPNFTEEEFRCKQTGRINMQESFMDRLQALRTAYGKPMIITSGFRHISHSAERQKARPGAHVYGHAADIAVSHADAYELIAMAIKHGFTGIGVQQKGNGRFIHLDDMPADVARPRPTVWSY